MSWTTRADLAEADAIILANEGRFDGISPALTALESFTLDDVAAIASEISGREIKRVTVSDDDWVESKVAQGVPAPMAQMLLGMFVAARRGDFAAARFDAGKFARSPPANNTRHIGRRFKTRPKLSKLRRRIFESKPVKG